MKRTLALVATMVALALPGAARAADDAVIDEVLGILKERGIVDEAKYQELVARNQAYEASQQTLLGRIEWSGDVRTRMENFFYDEDATGDDRSDRSRGRFRLRLGGVAHVNPWIDAGFQLVSGADDENRSHNRSFGDSIDFEPDPIHINTAWIAVKAPLEGQKLSLVVGRQENPFLWKNGRDVLIFDNDISMGGGSLRWSMAPTDKLSLFANAGYFMLDENSSDKDPHLAAFQGGFGFGVTETVSVGGRASWYSFGSSNQDVLNRGVAFGNLPSINDGPDDGVDVIELAGNVRWTGSERWPVLVYGHYAQNLSANSQAGFDDEDAGWLVGAEVGDKKQLVALGLNYSVVEANYFLAQFTDSDRFDGFTNREGWSVYGSREVAPNTELNLTVFVGDEHENGAEFSNSLSGADRVRLQTDLVVKF